ncbi:MAG TPA: phosphatase PAP2 family protein [Chloroflexota bacterium]|nr:phosphatase PAP2 family protein [Chloroflexota bacterium]
MAFPITIAAPRPVAEHTAWKPATRAELAVLGIYFLAVMILVDVVNVRPGIEVMTAVVALAAVAISRLGTAFIRDWWYFIAGLLMWNLSGPIARLSPFPWHLDFMLNLDRIIGLGRQPVAVVQHALYNPAHLSLIDVFTVVVYNMHLPEPFIAGYFLWRLNRLAYLRFAASVLILLVVGGITFVLFPAVPPWMAAKHLIYSGSQYVTSPQGHVYLPNIKNLFGPIASQHPLPFHGTPIFYLFQLQGDPVAAFPSEHMAFPMLEMITFTALLGKRGLILILWIAAVFFSVLYLGEHWVTDVIFGWLYAIVIFYFVRYATRSLDSQQN